MSITEQILSDIPGNPLVGLRRADELWSEYKAGPRDFEEVVTESDRPLEKVDYDVAICGGTLGILLGAALAQKGWNVVLLERGELKGREQEWNISRKELNTFVEIGLLSEGELEKAIASQYNPARISFTGGEDLWVEDILNIGVDPVYLLERLKQKFVENGGKLLEHTPFQSATVHSNGVAIKVKGAKAKDTSTVTTRLLIDAMGHFSPIVQQARRGKQPDAVCLVVGTCATGYKNNETGDLIVSFTPIQNQCQYFWEAFPARDGRTTYMFTYLDTHPSRPSIEKMFDDYFSLLPTYQNTPLEKLTFKRALFGFFPCYKRSPLQYTWNRTLAVGDSSGSQSPLSFGGFGAMVRHLQRLTDGIHEALTADTLESNALGLLQPYQPNLSVTWLFQKSMSVAVNQTLPPNRINNVLSAIFSDMSALGDDVLRPFLQDVVQFSPLAKTMLRTSLLHPGLVLKILPQVGPLSVLEWMRHFFTLAGYSALSQRPDKTTSIATTASQYRRNRRQAALIYGAGRDHS